jgi:cyclic pyranopterin phosphate synthase
VTPLIDSFGRVHDTLRVSVTDRCNYRCTYCLPEEGLTWLPREALLTYEEIQRLVGCFVALGVRRVRLTGGEPTLRRDLSRLVQGLAELPGLDDLSMTTNAHVLASMAGDLAEAGLHRINVSLDALDPDLFHRMTRGGDLARVLDGIDAALAAGLTPIKINTVVLEGENEDQVEPLLAWASERPADLQVRFIEYMPFEVRWHRCVPGAVLRERILRTRAMEPEPAVQGGGPAVHWRLPESGAVVGFISPLSERFCAGCNRLRLTAEGDLRTCLSDDGTPPLTTLLREGASDAAIQDQIRALTLGKREGHGCEVDGGVPFEGVMTRIGG